MSRTICMLVTIPNEESFENCTLSLKSVRVGFPDDRIEVSLNIPNDNYMERIQDFCITGNFQLIRIYEEKQQHAQWIFDRVLFTEGELIIIDPDMTFHKKWEFKYNTPIAGAHVPLMWNEWSQCISYPRLHTSFLCIKDTQSLRNSIKEYYPLNSKYAPFDPYSPCVRSAMGRKVFWDTCAGLYDIVPSTHFTEKEFEQFDHVNSSAFVEEMSKRMEYGNEFKQHHERIKRNPELLKGFWRETEAYYKRMHEKALTILAQ